MIVWCTGYKVTFPFFAEDFISAPDNDLPLYRRVFKPGIDDLFFIALLQPLGAIMPLAEAQGRWVASYLRGEYALPPQLEMEADMRRERERMFKRYVASKRHTMQVDFDNYLYALGKELKVPAPCGPAIRASGCRCRRGAEQRAPARRVRSRQRAPPRPYGARSAQPVGRTVGGSAPSCAQSRRDPGGRAGGVRRARLRRGGRARCDPPHGARHVGHVLQLLP